MIRFLPIYKEAPWGGSRFTTDFARRTPEATIGESWELVEMEGCESRVAQGPLEGKPLGELWRGGALGGAANGRFPFLLKWLNTRHKLSVQVHPDAEAVAKLGTGAAKSEAWYIADAEPASVLMLGHYPGLDAATLRLAATGGTIGKWLYEVRPRIGDMYGVPAGTLHSIGAGLLILEVQEPSETTFRLFDWGSLDGEGRPRALHVDEACTAVNYKRSGAPRPERDAITGPSYSMRALRMGIEIAPRGLRVFVADSGPAKLVGARGDTLLEYGDVIVAEPSDGAVRLATGTCVLVADLPDRLRAQSA